MNNEPCRKPVPPGYSCIPRVTAARLPAFVDEFRARGPMNGSINTAAPEQAGIGGIDYRIHVQFGNVCPDRLYLPHNKTHLSVTCSLRRAKRNTGYDSALGSRITVQKDYGRSPSRPVSGNPGP